MFFCLGMKSHQRRLPNVKEQKYIYLNNSLKRKCILYTLGYDNKEWVVVDKDQSYLQMRVAVHLIFRISKMQMIFSC